MTAPTLAAKAIVSDARAMFDYYLQATTEPSFRRIASQSPDGIFLYPEATCQADAGAFAGVFNCLWRALGTPGTFQHYYAAKTTAFAELVQIVTPNTPDPHRFTTHARFWMMDIQTPVADANAVHRLCRTLHNGFSHFNFRYIDVAPSDYFRQMDLALPPHIPDPTAPSAYRIFICDWNKQRRGFMQPGSDTRIVETHFAHLRYHLFLFLARFFSEPGIGGYHDILTDELIS